GQAEAAHRNVEPKEKGRQIRGVEIIEVPRIAERRDNAADNGRNKADDDCPPCDVRELSTAGRRHRAASSIFTLSPEGRSSSFALRLNCNARMYAMIAQRSAMSIREA